MPPKGYRKMTTPPNDEPQHRELYIGRIRGTIDQGSERIPPIPRRRQWEYTTLSAERPLNTAQYDAYGADGWELVSVYVRMDAVHAVFKREVV